MEESKKINVWMKAKECGEVGVSLSRFKVIHHNNETLLLGEIDDGPNKGSYVWTVTDISVDISNLWDVLFPDDDDDEEE